MKLKTLKNYLKNFMKFYIVLTFILVGCSSNSSNTETVEENLPGVVMVAYVLESDQDTKAKVGASAYTLDNFPGGDLSLSTIAEVGTTGLMNILEFHFDKSLKVWVEKEGSIESTNVFVSSIASSGIVNFANDLLGLWTVSKVNPEELYHVDFTDDDGTVYSGTIKSENFVRIDNYEDGDSITGDELELEWNADLVLGELALNIVYTDVTGEKHSEYLENIPNTGSYTLDVSHMSNSIKINFYHTVKQPGSEDLEHRFNLFLMQRSEINLNF